MAIDGIGAGVVAAGDAGCAGLAGGAAAHAETSIRQGRRSEGRIMGTPPRGVSRPWLRRTFTTRPMAWRVAGIAVSGIYPETGRASEIRCDELGERALREMSETDVS
ncbi:MAG TPA: hypothetical protein VFK02_30495 [Kofleriaceae bacterium]|nr:hypothetical protein [Kofleriaceae bacterium]